MTIEKKVSFNDFALLNLEDLKLLHKNITFKISLRNIFFKNSKQLQTFVLRIDRKYIISLEYIFFLFNLTFFICSGF